MRHSLCLILLLAMKVELTWAQEITLKTTVPLVVAPTTVVDRAGHFVRGLEASDLRLFDNNVAREIQVDELTSPISLVIAVESADTAWAVLEKIKKVGSLIQPLVAGERGEAAVLWYGSEITVAQDFTSDTGAIEKVFRQAKPNGGGGRVVDAVAKSVELLAARKDHRKVVLVIGESKDHGSQTRLEQAIGQAQRENVTVYFLTYSRVLTPYTFNNMNPVCDEHHENCHARDPQWGGMDLSAVFEEIHALAKTSAAEAFTKFTGGRRASFLRQRSLEETIAAVGEEIHNQYIISFTPPHAEPDQFHAIRIEVRNRPDVVVRTRPGYWPVP